MVTHSLYPRQFIQLCDFVALLVPNYYCRDTFYAIKLLLLAGGHQKVYKSTINHPTLILLSPTLVSDYIYIELTLVHGGWLLLMPYKVQESNRRSYSLATTIWWSSSWSAPISPQRFIHSWVHVNRCSFYCRRLLRLRAVEQMFTRYIVAILCINAVLIG